MRLFSKTSTIYFKHQFASKNDDGKFYSKTIVSLLSSADQILASILPYKVVEYETEKIADESLDGLITKVQTKFI